MGAVWAFNAGDSALDHAIRFGILLFVIAPLASHAYGRRLRARGLARPDVSLPRMLAAKAGLVAAALVTSALLGRWMGGADYVVAAGLAVTIAVAGPALHQRLFFKPAVEPAAA